MSDDIEIRVEQCAVYDVCADETFDSAYANRRMGHLLPESFDERVIRPLDVYGTVRKYLAGMRRPSPERVIELVRDITGIEDWEKGAIHELFAQLSPMECHEFLLSTNGTPREVARLMRDCGVRRGLVVNWINQLLVGPPIGAKTRCWRFNTASSG